jgi:hypothetical protein
MIWVLAIAGWVWVVGEQWYSALSGGFTELRSVQVVLATGLGVFFIGKVVALGIWRGGPPREGG